MCRSRCVVPALRRLTRVPLCAMQGRVDVALALHACGNATDYAIAQAVHWRGAYVVCPCCLGKLKFSLVRVCVCVCVCV